MQAAIDVVPPGLVTDLMPIEVYACGNSGTANIDRTSGDRVILRPGLGEKSGLSEHQLAVMTNPRDTVTDNANDPLEVVRGQQTQTLKPFTKSDFVTPIDGRGLLLHAVVLNRGPLHSIASVLERNPAAKSVQDVDGKTPFGAAVAAKIEDPDILKCISTPKEFFQQFELPGLAQDVLIALRAAPDRAAADAILDAAPAVLVTELLPDVVRGSVGAGIERGKSDHVFLRSGLNKVGGLRERELAAVMSLTQEKSKGEDNEAIFIELKRLRDGKLLPGTTDQGAQKFRAQDLATAIEADGTFLHAVVATQCPVYSVAAVALRYPQARKAKDTGGCTPGDLASRMGAENAILDILSPGELFLEQTVPAIVAAVTLAGVSFALIMRGLDEEDLRAAIWLILCSFHATVWIFMLWSLGLGYDVGFGAHVRLAMQHTIPIPRMRSVFLVKVVSVGALIGMSVCAFIARGDWTEAVADIVGLGLHLPALLNVFGVLNIADAMDFEKDVPKFYKRRQRQAVFDMTRFDLTGVMNILTGNGPAWASFLLHFSVAAPLFLLVAPPLALERLGLSWGATGVAAMLFLCGAGFVWRRWPDLRRISPTVNHEAVDKAGERVPAITFLPAGSTRPLLGRLIDIVTFMAIAFMPAMPTMALDFSAVPLWAIWWKDLNVGLRFLVGDFALFDFDSPTINPYHLQITGVVITALVVFPLWMDYLGKTRTSVEQAEFIVLAYETVAMFMTNNLVGGFICTDYTDRTYVVMENVALRVDQILAGGASPGDKVYITDAGEFSSSWSEDSLLYGRVVSNTALPNASATVAASSSDSWSTADHMLAQAYQDDGTIPVQITGRWLDAADFSIQCGSVEQAFISTMCMLALAFYFFQVLNYAVEYGKKSSVVIIDQRYMLVSLMLKIVLAVAAAAIGSCHPNMLIAVELGIVLLALLMLLLIRPTNVRTMDHVSTAGFLTVLFTLSVTGWVAATHDVDEACTVRHTICCKVNGSSGW